MALKIEPNQSATAYNIVTGATLFPYAVDAQHAISAHPLEWSDVPWSTRDDASAARDRLNEQNEAAGQPKLPDPVPLSPDDQKALDDHNKAVADAKTRLDAYYKKKADDEKIAAQVAADETLVASVPPQPDPTARRPLSPAQLRKASATLTPQEQADKDAIDKQAADDNAAEEKRAADQVAAKKAADAAKKAADDKAVADKAEADRIGNAINATKPAS